MSFVVYVGIDVFAPVSVGVEHDEGADMDMACVRLSMLLLWILLLLLLS